MARFHSKRVFLHGTRYFFTIRNLNLNSVCFRFKLIFIVKRLYFATTSYGRSVQVLYLATLRWFSCSIFFLGIFPRQSSSQSTTFSRAPHFVLICPLPGPGISCSFTQPLFTAFVRDVHETRRVGANGGYFVSHGLNEMHSIAWFDYKHVKRTFHGVF